METVLETFAERITRTERDNLAAQLPDAMKEILYQVKDTEQFELEEFYNRVTLRLDIGFPNAVKHSRSVMVTLKEAVSQGQIQDILNQLPPEYEEIFEKEPEGPISPTSKSPDEPYAEPS